MTIFRDFGNFIIPEINWTFLPSPYLWRRDNFFKKCGFPFLVQQGWMDIFISRRITHVVTETNFTLWSFMILESSFSEKYIRWLQFKSTPILKIGTYWSTTVFNSFLQPSWPLGDPESWFQLYLSFSSHNTNMYNLKNHILFSKTNMPTVWV